MSDDPRDGYKSPRDRRSKAITVASHEVPRLGDGRPPYSPEAESAMIGASILSADALQILAEQLEPEDFYTPKWKVVCAHMQMMWKAGTKVEVVTLMDEMKRTGDDELVGVHVTDLFDAIAEVPSIGVAAAANYTRTIIDYSARRRMMTAALEVFEASKDGSVGVDAIMEIGRSTFGSIEMPVLSGVPDLDVQEFMDGSMEYDWLIFGLMERRDRLILTGGEGGGKSTLLRQVAVCAAAGVHPFRGNDPEYRDLRPIRVSLFDLENSEVQIRRKMRELLGVVNRMTRGGFDPGNLRINAKTDGLDLMQRTDVRWLLERIEANEPELIVIGPIYKLHSGDPIEEGPARHVSRVIDMIRARYGCAVLMEAHSPYATNDGKRVGRPYGASLWSRWPEFGYCIVRDPDDPTDFSLEAWRGPRDEREWPEKLERGDKDEVRAGKAWPWAQPEGSWERHVERRHTEHNVHHEEPYEVDDSVGF